MIYWGVFIFLVIIALQENGKKTSIKAFNLCFFFLTIMVMLRKGQGQDYYNYLLIYNETVHYGKLSFWLVFVLSDPLYRLLNLLAYYCGVSYYFFSALFSLLTMYFYYTFFRKYCNGSILSLLIFYSMCYIIYVYSSVRQGFAVAVEISVLYPLLLKRKWGVYYMVLLPLCLIHQSAIICALFPFIVRKKISNNVWLIMGIISTVLMLSGVNLITKIPFPDPIAIRLKYYTDSLMSGRTVAHIVRMILILPVFLIPYKIYNKNEELCCVRNILLAGYILYGFTAFSEVISSRLNIYFRIFECYFVYLLLYKTSLKVINRQIAVGYVIVYAVLFANTIKGFIIQGDYQYCNILTYPCLTVFDGNDTIFYYRKNLGYGDELMVN